MNTPDIMGSESRHRSFRLPRKGRWFLLVISLACVIASCLLTFRAPHNRLSDFAGYYTASKLVVTGDSVASMYDDQWFIGRMGQFGILDQKMVFYVNPPTVSLVMLPLTGLDPAIAKVVWTGIGLALLLLVLFLVKDLLQISAASGLTELFLAVLVCSIPFLRNMQRGQMYLLILVLVVLTWRGYELRQPWLTGMSLATLLLLKYFGWLFVLLLLFDRRWRELSWTGFSLIVGFSISIALLGIETYAQHFERLLTSLGSFDVASTSLPSLPALFGGLFMAHPLWNKIPVNNSPLLSIVLMLASLALLLVLTFRFHLRSPDRQGSFGFFSLVILSVLFTPLAADHHYLMLALPILFVARWIILSGLAGGYFLALGLSSYLILGWLPNLPIDSHAGWFKLLGFGRVYGALLLWFLLISASGRISARTLSETTG